MLGWRLEGRRGAGAARPPIPPPQPPGAPRPQVLREWTDAEKCTALLQHPSATTTFRSHMPKNGGNPHFSVFSIGTYGSDPAAVLRPNI